MYFTTQIRIFLISITTVKFISATDTKNFLLDLASAQELALDAGVAQGLHATLQGAEWRASGTTAG